MENFYKNLAKSFGVEFNEEFTISTSNRIFIIDNDGIYSRSTYGTIWLPVPTN